MGLSLWYIYVEGGKLRNKVCLVWSVCFKFCLQLCYGTKCVWYEVCVSSSVYSCVTEQSVFGMKCVFQVLSTAVSRNKVYLVWSVFQVLSTAVLRNKVCLVWSVCFKFCLQLCHETKCVWYEVCVSSSVYSFVTEQSVFGMKCVFQVLSTAVLRNKVCFDWSVCFKFCLQLCYGTKCVLYEVCVSSSVYSCVTEQSVFCMKCVFQVLSTVVLRNKVCLVWSVCFKFCLQLCYEIFFLCDK